MTGDILFIVNLSLLLINGVQVKLIRLLFGKIVIIIEKRSNIYFYYKLMIIIISDGRLIITHCIRVLQRQKKTKTRIFFLNLM